jgi:DNA mismatch repair protein MutS
MNENLIYNEYYKAQEELEEKYGSNSIVLMMVGSFYEIYSVDLPDNKPKLKIGKAEEAHNILGMNITKKNKGKDHAINNPFMVGFPDYALDEHLGKLLRANMTVAIYDQFDSKKNGKPCKIRSLTHIYTPSTFIDDTKTDDNSLLSFELSEFKSPRNGKMLKKIHVAVLCLNTGKVYLLEAYDTANDNGRAEAELYRIIHSYNPSEIICSGVDNSVERNKIEKYYDLGMKKLYFRQIPKEYSKKSYQDEFLRKIYSNLDGIISMIDYLNLDKHVSIIPQFIQALQFAYEQDKLIVSKIQKPEFIQPNSHLILNNDSLYQLNLIESPFDMSKTLFDVICKAKTPIGKRLLKQSLLTPLNNVEEITERYDLIEKLWNNYEEYGTILRGIVDIEKKFRKMVLHTLHPYELADMEITFNSVKKLLDKGKTVFNITDELIAEYKCFYDEYMNTFDFNILKRCKLKDIKGSFFLSGVNDELDTIDDKINSGKQVLNTIASEFSKYVASNTKTSELVKLDSTDKEGWYLSITKARFNSIPKNLKITVEYNGTKYIITYDELETTKLTNSIKIHCSLIRKISNDINFLKSRLNDVLLEEYTKLLDHYTKDYEKIFIEISQIIGKIDFIYSASKTANEYAYSRPIITDKLDGSSYFTAKGIRHPIIERINDKEEYITNDISLGTDEHYGSILYGLNMSGKTSLMRSVGCNIVMAQAGLYTSCEKLEYYPFNCILSKLTIRDNMSKGQSTFMVEMLEVKNMLMRADCNTLVLSDELCSSTESTSGHSIVAQALYELSNKRAKFIFSTHLHNLQQIPVVKDNKHIKIWHFKVHIKEDKIIFDRHIELGGMTELYGLEVAKALGLPEDFIRGAFNIRDFLTKQPTELLSTKKSRYNSNVYVHSCNKCGSTEDLHTHHINHQESANKKGIINNKFHKNSKFNLEILCKKCHQELHNNEH